MSDQPERPAEAALIAACREAPPRMSMRQAALKAGISPARWQQLENGYRMFRGERYPERAPAPTLAQMALVVRATPQQLREVGRADAAGELEALLLDAEMLPTERQREAITRRIQRDT